MKRVASDRYNHNPADDLEEEYDEEYDDQQDGEEEVKVQNQPVSSQNAVNNAQTSAPQTQ
eukprot:CAMPEP_0176401590 /NCGR_PEP_ID=MMETSP0126-20121128/48558_1 /TAXON_ID=141414 ORGANISM="Strombidinopsis acuminatum, Strain SPMC142" /NCGR_SAMPLE_ID=MMETSP0126 /ASSEMBLY_ACC=CAM_ASM_000229 /LENGTH=59 /DNA_ID=CAMNT_0017778615 /DNA_START=721 /DNA_END=900 /DNA_ORIENTATION=+